MFVYRLKLQLRLDVILVKFSCILRDKFNTASPAVQEITLCGKFKFCSQMMVVKHYFNSMLHKIVSAEEISYAHICK